jgi:hypothetical protein
MTNIDSDLLTDENLDDYKIEDDVKLYNDLAVGQWSLNGNFAWRVNAINTLAPWLVRTGRAGAVNELAQMNISDDEIVTRSSELSAAWKGTELMKMMENLNASEQRAWWAQMSFSQQRTLEAAGYKLPRNGINTASGAAQFFGQITKPAQWALSDVGKPVGSALIKALSFGYDQTVARQWRTIAQLGPEAKIGAAVGGAGGFVAGAGLAAGISAATGGIGTLPTLAILGLSTLTGASVGSFTASALTGNAENWIQAWARAGDGEKLFTSEAISEVNRKLGGSPELQALVVRVSAEIGTDIDLAELVQEVSGQREVTISKQIGKLQKIAAEYAPQGTAEYSMIMRGLTEIVGDPIVQEAILTLQQGKYSMGRSFARTLNLDPNSSAYHYVSGGIDAAAMILLDPLNIATAGVKAFQTIKRGIDVVDGTVAAAKFRALAEEPAFARVFDLVAEGVRTGNTMKVRRYAKQWFPIYDDLLTYAKTGADVSVQNFSGKDVVEFIVGHSHLKSVTSGIGIVPGINRLVLKPLTRRGYAFKTVTGETLDFFRGISDLSLEKVITKIADNPDALRQIFKDIPSDNVDEILASNILPDEWADILIKESGLGQGYSLGRTAGKLPGISHVLRPVAQVIDSLNTAVPRGKAIWLIENSERNNDIVNFVDLFRVLGMPTYARELWKKQIFDAPDFRGRVNAISSLMDSIATAAGMRNTQEGLDLLDNFLTKFKQEFAVGQAGKTVGHAPHVYVAAGVRPVADMAQMIAIPDLKELRQAVKSGTALRFLLGIPEDSVVLANAMRFWKPAVLFRLGFAFRNSGEDLLAMIARYGLGSFIQEFGARSIGKRDAFKEATRIRNEMNRLYQLGQGGVKLTTQQRYILNHYEFPVGFNKIANAVRKLGPTGSPILHVIEEWSKYVQQFFEGGLSGLTNIKTIANVEKRMAQWQDIENIGIAKRLAPRKVTENLKFVADHMAWGNKYSARRMLAGGVNPMLAQAGREWASTHVFTIMQRLGTAPGFGLDYQGRELSAMQRMFQNEEPNFAIVQGERTLRFKDQPDGDLIEDYHTALYNQFTGLTEDPIMRQALVEVLKVYDPSMRAMLPPDQVVTIFNQWHELTQVFGVGIAPKLENTIVHMFLRLNENTDQVIRAERFQDMLRKLSDTKLNEQSLIPGKLANSLSNKYRGLSTPSPEDFLDELFSMTSVMAPIATKLKQLDNLQTMLNSVSDPVAKEWLLAHFMRDWATDGEHISSLMAIAGDKGGDITSAFYTTFDEARDAMASTMGFEFSSGNWDAALNRNRRIIDSDAEPTFVIDFQRLPDWSSRLSQTVAAQPFDELAELGPDVTQAVLRAIDDRVPFVVTDKDTAELIRSAVDARLKLLNPNQASTSTVIPSLTSPVSPVDYIVPPLRQVFLPIDNTNPSALQDLWTNAGPSTFASAQTVVSVDAANGRKAFQVSGWPTDTYPWNKSYLGDAPVRASDEEIIEAAIDTIAQIVRPGFNQQWISKQDLWTEFQGEPLLIPAGTKLDTTTNLWSTPDLAEGSFVQIDDFRFTEALIPQYSGQGEVQWRAFAPLMYDDAERLAGRTANAPRSAPILVDDSRLTSKVQAPLFDETVEVPRFTDKDIVNIPQAERPNAVVAKRRTLNAEPTGWDKLVYIGFNKILGPMMDAMSRKPMAFHAFAVNFERNIKMASWRLTGTVQENAVNDLISRLISRGLYEQADSDTSKIITEAARIIGRDHAIDVADFWTDGQAFAYLRGYIREVGETKFLDELTTMIADGKTTFSQQQRASLDYLRRNTPRVQSMSLDFGGPQDFLDNLIGYLGDDFVRAPGVAARLGNIGSPMLEDLVKNMTDKDWKILSDYRAMRNKLVEESSAVAAEAAIRDTLPYVDSHEIRSQFADWGRGYMPFWYAEENFIKRWAKILAMDNGLNGLNFLRKTHMTYTGLRHVGFIRRDSNGTDYFIYPGSELFVEAIARVSGVNPKTLSHFLESRTDRMLPGIGSDFGRPSFGPFAILPVKFFTWMVPQIDPTGTTDRPMKEFERSFLGDVGLNRTIWQTLIPKTVLTTLEATGAFKRNSFDMSLDERLMSSQNSAIAYMEASGIKSDSNPDGMALPDAATVEERDEYLRDAREFAKAGFIAQMLAGWIVPGPVSQNVGVESENIIDFLTGGVNKSPDELLAKDYITLVKDLGIEDGTIAFMNLYRRENGAFNSQVLFNPLAFTVGATESVSGAPLPSTEDAVKFYLNNQEAYDQWPYAGPWLLPQDQEGDARSKWAYDQTVIAGLRTYRGTSKDFLTELKFKEAALVYFDETRKYDQAIEAATFAGNTAAKKQIETFKKVFVDNFKAAHPYFAQELQSEKARTRRLQIVSEMTILINDPDFPGQSVPHFEGIKEITLAYQDYKNYSGYVRPDGSDLTDKERAVLLQQLDVFGQAMVKKYPGVVAYWTTVIKPLAGIDS